MTEADEQLKAANSEPSEATPAIPDDSQELPEYLADAYTFSLQHQTTRDLIFSTIERLKLESSDTSGFAKPNSRTLFQYNTEGMSTDEILKAIREVSQLSSEELALLEDHRRAIDALHIRVKGDHVSLMQIIPPVGGGTRFYGKALATLDKETFLLVSLLSFYYSPELKRKGSVFSNEFPSRLAEAGAQLDGPRVSWQRAVDELDNLFRERGLPPPNLLP